MDHSRLAIALHIPQDLLPLSGVGSQSNGSKLPSSKAVGSGSGYGPPIAPEGTPLSRLVSSTLYTSATDPTPSEASIAGYVGAGGRTEYDLVCLPLTNPSWQERWERMCTISTSGTMMDLNASSNTNGQGEGSEEWTRREAETWRAGGGFARGEVNVTRSGTTSSSHLSFLFYDELTRLD
jgi:protein arginine N-methyltransferase 5